MKQLSTSKKCFCSVRNTICFFELLFELLKALNSEDFVSKFYRFDFEFYIKRIYFSLLISIIDAMNQIFNVMIKINESLK